MTSPRRLPSLAHVAATHRLLWSCARCLILGFAVTSENDLAVGNPRLYKFSFQRYVGFVLIDDNHASDKSDHRNQCTVLGSCIVGFQHRKYLLLWVFYVMELIRFACLVVPFGCI